MPIRGVCVCVLVLRDEPRVGLVMYAYFLRVVDRVSCANVLLVLVMENVSTGNVKSRARGGSFIHCSMY